MSNITHFIFDFETLGQPPNPVLLELSCIAFRFNDGKTYEDYVAEGFKVKFNIQEQREAGRIVDQGAVDFWKKQPKDLQSKMLTATEYDVSLKEGFNKLMEYLAFHKIKQQTSIAWCRGQSFDFPLLNELAATRIDGGRETFNHEPVRFWNQRDIRSFIAGSVGDFTKTNIPVRHSEAPGFIAHDSIHDCAKDILMLKKAYMLANGVDGPEVNFSGEKEDFIESTLR